MITTPSSAWVAAADAAPGVSTSTADECEAACKGVALCQYYIFRTDQEDTTPGMGNGCFFKMAPASGDANTFTAFRLWTGDYVVWQVGMLWGGALGLRSVAGWMMNGVLDMKHVASQAASLAPS